jgi:hypothetical protein
VSRRIPVETNARIPSPDNATGGQGPIRLVLALVWLGLFSGWFYSFGLPNNRPAERWMVWSALPFDLLDLLDPPTAEPPALPWSWLNLAQRLPFLAVAVFIWTAAVCMGRLELRALRLFSLFDRAERLFFAACLGLSTLSLLMLGLGLAGWMSRWPLLIALLIVMLAELVRVPRTWSRHGRVFDRKHGHTADVETAAPVNNAAKSSWLPWIVIGIVTPFVFCMLLGAMSPQTDFDVIEYHLGGPKEWFLQGQITRLPHNVYTSFPFLTEMLVLSGMVLYGDWNWGALAGQATIAGFAPLVAIGLYATAARRWFSVQAGWLAALIWLTTPWVYRISIIAYAEGGLACYLFAAFAISLRIVWPDEYASQTTAGDQPRPSNQPLALYSVCGFLAGSAMACKYTGLISVIIPVGLLIAGVTARQALKTADLRRMFLTGVAFALGLLVAIGPWLLKNTLETGNPVFPLAYSIFGGKGRDASMNEQWKRGHSSHYASLSDWIWDWPVKLIDVVANNDWHSVLMFAFAPIALLAVWRQKVWLIWAFVGWQFLTWFLFTHHIDRFYVPMFPVVALLAGCGASWLWTRTPGRWCGGVLIAASLAFNVWIMQNIGGFNAGRTDLRAAENLVVSPSQRWLNGEFATGRLPTDFKVLCVGEAALFHAKFPYLYNTVFDRSLFEQCFADKSPEESREWLSQRGITHVLVNWSEILRYREPGSYGYTDFAHPDTFAKLQTAGLLGPALPLPDAASFVPVNDAKRQQVADWAPSLGVMLGDRPAIKAVQVFPVRL